MKTGGTAMQQHKGDSRRLCKVQADAVSATSAGRLPRASHVVASATVAAALLWAGVAVASDGLIIPDSAWPQWQARVSLGAAATPGAGLAGSSGAPHRVVAANLLGDYYFSPLGQGLTASGFRATSGLLVGNAPLGAFTSPVRLGSPFSVGRASLWSGDGSPESAEPQTTLPYIGLGYSRLALQGGWGFSADLGLVAHNPSGAWQLGRALFGPARGLEDAVRQMRLAPVVQVGVRYTF